MKIVYIGKSDELAEKLIERMGQEGNDVYLLSNANLPHKLVSLHHHYYRNPQKGEAFEQLLCSISPDIVIFAGDYYISSRYKEEVDEDLTLLAHSLRAVTTLSNVKFILLSSIEVYGNTAIKADESLTYSTVSERGIHFVREEQLLEIYHKQYNNINAVILRASQLYTNHPKTGNEDFLSQSYSAAINGYVNIKDDIIQPLHIYDFVDAIKRVIDNSEQYIYNVSGSIEISMKQIYQLICQQEKIQQKAIHWENSDHVTIADSSLIRQQLGWTNFRNLEEQIQNNEIRYTRVLTNEKKQKKNYLSSNIRLTIENILIFTVFFALQSFFGAHSLFSQINWLLIYVILISISYPVSQSTLAAVLASGAYLYEHSINVFKTNTFYTYADSVLVIMEYAFISLIVSYSINTFRQKVKNERLDYEMLNQEYEDLKAINEENVLIKKEYEERILTSKSSFPKLYSMISRLMVEEPERILMETMQVISELMRTDTVAVYRTKEKNPWLRLVGALTVDSAMEEKTWNLLNSPKIYDAVMRGELYQGELGSDDPAVVLPIMCWGVPEAVVLIKKIPYECESLYHVNLLKTMSLLLRDSMEKALKYEDVSRKDHYIENTEVLKLEAFYKRILLAKEKADKYVAEYCVVEFIYSGSLISAANMLAQILRVTDCLGTDEKGKLFALLDNTNHKNLECLEKRLLSCNVEMRLIMDESVMIADKAILDSLLYGKKVII